MTRGPGRPPHPDLLTPAEWDVVHKVRHGMTNRQIAARRGTTVDAVKFHIENIRDKAGLASRSDIRLWKALPEKHKLRDTMTTPTDLNLGHLGQISHAVTDIERSVAFFRDTLGLRHLFTAGQLAFFDCAGTRLMVDALPEARGRGNSVLYFRVPEIHSATDMLKARGATFTGEPHLIHTHPDGTEEWMSFFNDPDGHTLALQALVLPS